LGSATPWLQSRSFLAATPLLTPFHPLCPCSFLGHWTPASSGRPCSAPSCCPPVLLPVCRCNVTSIAEPAPLAVLEEEAGEPGGVELPVLFLELPVLFSELPVLFFRTLLPPFLAFLLRCGIAFHPCGLDGLAIALRSRPGSYFFSSDSTESGLSVLRRWRLVIISFASYRMTLLPPCRETVLLSVLHEDENPYGPSALIGPLSRGLVTCSFVGGGSANAACHACALGLPSALVPHREVLL
jgi:hypothetical protein